MDDKKSHLRLVSALKGVKRERESEGDGERDFGSPGISAGSEADEIDVIKDKPRRGNRSIVWTDEEQVFNFDLRSGDITNHFFRKFWNAYTWKTYMNL